jgi:hypothetical protein
MAADPRATHDADYYLSKEFPRDVEEAEWLYTSVIEIDDRLRVLEPDRKNLLGAAHQRMSSDQRLVEPDQWTATSAYLEELAEDLTPRLRRVIALRGIRLEELELLTHYSNEIPTLCRIVGELHGSGWQAVTALAPDATDDAAPDLHRVLCERLTPHMRALDDCLRDLEVFIPLWRRGISQRRALLLHASETGGADAQHLS